MSKAVIDFFDLEEIDVEEQESFMEEIGSLVMKAVLRKAWIELDTVKRDTLMILLEESASDPENETKYEAVFSFLDENVEKIRDYAKNEMESIMRTYTETKEAIEQGAE